MATNNSLPETTYGFIGLGNMGFGMAKNVRAKIPKSSKLIVCELSEARREEFLDTTEGLIEAADTPKELAEKADIILTSLPTGPSVKKVFTDPKTGLLAIGKGGNRKFFLELSTIEVSTSNEVSKAVEESGLGDFLDAPVSGGIPGADQGTLSLMVGGTEELFARGKPILATMGKAETITYCGPPGAGLATKQINNYIAYCGYIALCEGMNTGVKWGLDPKVLAKVINESSGMNWNSLNMNPIKGVQPNSSSSRNFEGGFKTELAKGVLDMAVGLMDETGAKHVFGNVVKDVYARAAKDPRCANKESRSIFRLIAEDDGKALGKTVVE